MKCKLLIVLFGVILLMPCVSCKKEEPTIISVDFGEGKYKEPFRGFLSSHPQWLVATLDWPVLRSLRPDTLVLTKTIELEFNEDAVRSNSEAVIQFVDDSCNRLEGVKVYCNDLPVGKEGFRIKATTEPQLIKIAYKIDPLKKKCTETGLFTVSGVELDEVNSVKLYSDTPKSVADWTYTQKIGWPLLLWLLWLIIALIIIAIFVLIIVFIVKGIGAILKNVSMPNPGPTSFGSRNGGGLPPKMDDTKMNDLRRLTHWPDEIIRHISSMEEAKIYIKAGLKAEKIGGRWALIRSDINWSDYSVRRNTWLKDKLADYDSWKGYNNADLIGEGFPPRDMNGNPYELHHIGQHQDSPLAELTYAEHMGDGNNTILHQAGKESEIDRQMFDREKLEYWKARFNAFTPSELRKIYGK